MSEVQQRSPRLGSTYRPRIKGPERAAIARDLAAEYHRGATIRFLAEDRKMSYGTVRKLLLEGKARLRGRGGRLVRR